MEILRNQVKEMQPLIHCITNPISITQCANAVLAIGARPIMAEHPAEVEEITATAKALMLNLGNITDVRMQSMLLAGKKAMERQIPVMLDAVGTACSALRRNFTETLLHTVSPAVLKGNYSEIHALCHFDYAASGVDADNTLTRRQVEQDALLLAKKTGAVILASGEIDLVTDGERIWYIKNGSSQLASVTGTGCMLGALCTGYLSAGDACAAAVTACAVLGICGELAETEKGSGSFLCALVDRLSTLKEEEWKERLKLEVKNIE